MNVNDWAVFTRAAELGSLSAAGRDLRLSPAVVSNRIAKLERHLGVRLLHRTTRRASLTEEGEIFYRLCSRFLREVEEIESTLAARREQPRGTVTVSVPVGFGRRHVAPFIPLFTTRYPDVQVRLHLTDRLIDLVDSGTDLAVRIADLTNQSFVARKLANDRRVIVAAPAYLEREGRPETPEDLLRHNCLLLRFPGSQQFQWTLQTPDGPSALAVSGKMDSDNGEVLTAWCLAGEGLALKSLWEVGEALRDGRLVSLLPDHPPVAHAISALHPGGSLLPPRVRVFIDFLVHLYRPTPYWEQDRSAAERLADLV